MEPLTPNRRRMTPNGGPSVLAPLLWSAGDVPGQPLTSEDRDQLATIATIARFRKGEVIYQEGGRADNVFNVVTGLVKSYRELPDKSQHVVGFLFPWDIFGLAEYGKYMNSASALTDVTLYKVPTTALETRLRRSPRLDLHIICKLCHEVREAQHHAFMVSRQRATAKLGLFVQMLEAHHVALGRPAGSVSLEMSRVEIGAYLGLSAEAVSRALHELAVRGAIRLQGRRQVTITDRTRLEAATAD